jgi:nucleotide-binding universal stress UspA family protein
MTGAPAGPGGDRGVRGCSFADPILVGIDGSGVALDAVRWAAAEAVRRKLPLRVVHVCSMPALGQDWLREAVSVATVNGPDLTVDTCLQIGDPTPHLVAESARAAMLVVGWRGLGDGRQALLGSVARDLATHSRAPVVIVRGRLVAEGPVLIGVNGAESPASPASSALSFGFDEADLRVTSATVLRSTGNPGPAQERALAEDLRAWEVKYPGVPVNPVVVAGSPAANLIEHGATAQLIVVAGQCVRMTAGHALVRHAPCPVAVVRGP